MMDFKKLSPLHLIHRFLKWFIHKELSLKFSVFLTFLVSVSCGYTYFVLSKQHPLAPTNNKVFILLNINLVLLVLLGGVIAKQLVHLWHKRKKGVAGSSLHVRLVILFSFLATAPALVIVVFSLLFFNFSIREWFSPKIQTALNESYNIADAYLKEHKSAIQGDALAMAHDINRLGGEVIHDKEAFQDFIDGQTLVRSLSEAVVFDQSGNILANSHHGWSSGFNVLSNRSLSEARQKGISIIDDENRIQAIVLLNGFLETFLYISRIVNPEVLDRVRNTRSAVDAYHSIEAQSTQLQIRFALIFMVVALLLLLLAIWLSITFANRLIKPIKHLIVAAERVSAGDFSVRVHVTDPYNELEYLGNTFNHMTEQLTDQRTLLINANRELNQRRRFSEAVLEGVSAGVIGLDADGNITAFNKKAAELLEITFEEKKGTPIQNVIPAVEAMIIKAKQTLDSSPSEQIEILCGSQPRTLRTKVSIEMNHKKILGFVVTFDDISDLMIAQRLAAWSEIAKRIAHEIKNPLTPIQLSAERLKRRYLKEIKPEDQEVFTVCTDTIIRQVDDIGRMVDEFSAFARMPAPVFKENDLVQVCRESIALESHAHTIIDFKIDTKQAPIMMLIDARLIRQSLQNIVKNARQAIFEHYSSTELLNHDNKIHLYIDINAKEIEVSVEDSGPGFPKNLSISQLLEPYITLRQGGTGLGLAIVRKIMEDHQGKVMLGTSRFKGAKVSLVFPVSCLTQHQIN
jgi:two-component system, NtrC family, nitrogen regulation sensor histidine kinase NtrY